MATKHKKLSRAKAYAAVEAISTLLRDTEHDERLPYEERTKLLNTERSLRALVFRLARDENAS